MTTQGKEKNEAALFLEAHDVRPTAVRLLLWRLVSNMTNTFALHDVEQAIPQMDRSSIFRTLRLFVEKHLLHEVDDGSGFQKYCVCRCHDEAHTSHIHFCCECCGKTYCMPHHQVPQLALPDGFVQHSQEYIIKGLCVQCNIKKQKTC